MRRLFSGLPRTGGGEGQARDQGQGRCEGDGRGDIHERKDAEERGDEEGKVVHAEGTKRRWLLAKNIIMAFRKRNQVNYWET